MKPILLFLTALLYHPVFAQYEYKDQPDSIYKTNQVKSRTLNRIEKKISSKQVEMYDREGRMIEVTFYHPADTINSRSVCGYDSAGRKVSEHSFIYIKWDSIARERKLNPAGPVKTKSLILFEYNSDNKLTKKDIKSEEGKLLHETQYTYDSLSEESTYINHVDTTSSSYRKIVFEKPLLPARLFGYSRRKNHTVKFDYTYTNSFDNQGRLVESVCNRTTPYPKELFDVTIISKKYYHYNKKGLFTKIITQSYRNGHINESRVVFDYEYW